MHTPFRSHPSRAPRRAALIGLLLLGACGRSLPVEPQLVAAYGRGTGHAALTLTHPQPDTVFPPDLAAPTWRWKDASPADRWLVRIAFADGAAPLEAWTPTRAWCPADAEWQAMRRRSRLAPAQATVLGVRRTDPATLVSAGAAAFSTSGDAVAAPLFYREVNLPFIEAVKDPSKIRWRFGPVSSKTAPPVVLTGLPVCGNCHSFSADGKTLGMDVDYSNDKGSYAIAATATETTLSRDKVITWSDYRRDDGVQTFGLLSQVSPDGRFVVSTVKDRSVFVPTKDLEFSQLFFPVQGILAIYRRDTRTFHALPGADDPQFVQSNPAWSPDGKFIVFARARAYDLRLGHRNALLTPSEAAQFLEGGQTVQFDLYRVPFNDGAGGTPEPLQGASHNGASNFFARYSPDGKWIVFTRARSFMLLQPDSQLYIVPAQGGLARRLGCNTPRMNSWHSWSPNGRWLVFASKANGPYTQLFLTHIDEDGLDTPAVLLDRFTAPDRAANIPEFVNLAPDAIQTIRDAFVDDQTYVRAAAVHFQAGDLVGAEPKVRKAVELAPDNPDTRKTLGIVLARLGKAAEAVEQFRVLVRLQPDDAEAHGHLANALATLGDHDTAVQHLELAVAKAPRHPKLVLNLGQALLMRGRFAEAVARLRTAVELAPADVTARTALGHALLATAQVDEAIALFRAVLAAAPDAWHARAGLDRALALQRGGGR